MIGKRKYIFWRIRAGLGGKAPCSPGKGLGLMRKIFIYGDRGLLRNYADALEFCGAQAIFAQNTEYAHDCSGLLLPGGGDIDPALYGQGEYRGKL